MPLVAGIDSSTQSTKVELRDVATGELVGSAKAPHPPTTPPVSEQDPISWWGALIEAMAQLQDFASDIAAVSIAGQQHGLVIVDVDGKVIRPAKLWNDTTSAPNAEALTRTLRPSAWANRCGLVPVASFTITKLAWVLEHEPDNYRRIAKVMLPHDWLTWFLTGNHVTDRGDASGTGWWSGSVGYRSDLLETVVVDGDGWIRNKLPRVLGPNESAGTVRPAAAEALGLGPDVLVGPGSGDNMGAALGLGLETSDVAISLGTSGTAYAISDRPVADTTGTVAGFADATGRYLPLVATLNATKVTDTVAGWLGTDASGLSIMALEAKTRPDGPVLVPYFDGERTPNLPDAAGRFVSLRNDTSRGDLARAAHVGVACGLLAGVDALAAAGVATGGTLRLIGGGARSKAYQRLVADLWGRPISVHAEGELVATGACVQAAAVAADSTVDDVAQAWSLKVGHPVEPTPGFDPEPSRAAYAEAANELTRSQSEPE